MNNEQRKSEKMVDEKYTRPQGLYQDRDVDHKKLRKLILDSKLAPCYPGDEECGFDLEECPICFLLLVLSKSQLLKMLHERHLYRVFSADEDPEFDSAYSSLPIVLAIDDQAKERIGASIHVALVGPDGDLVGVLRSRVKILDSSVLAGDDEF
ncbi:hypothetical protein TEA_029516 [Camellia sinensis var. sinensis]|uniref:Uncharacterized protein n=1 Tax=Camellia sinensis var. sinensis TaxID=542762 RepID=A0A4S4DA94_CAMSN|nr:hypothetical protein TEA_029516 [Camellia sinensis var. sinensis]